MAGATSSLRKIHALQAPLSARVEIPGSKSLTNRHLVLAALASGTSELRGVLASDDCDRLRVALTAMGARFEAIDGGWSGLSVMGVHGKPHSAACINLGDGGTPTRFMLAVAALCGEETTVDGSTRMRERPVGEGVEMLIALGASARFPRLQGALPIAIRGPLTQARIEVGQTASSQFISALLLIAPCMPEGLEVCFRQPPTSASYLELSIDALRAIGVCVDVRRQEDHSLASISIAAQPIHAHALQIEPDASSAVYFAALAALVGGSVDIAGLHLEIAQPDLFFFEDLQQRGASISNIDCAVRVTAGTLRARDTDYERAPDAAVMAMVLAACADAPSTFTGLRTLRVKESDRIASVAEGLRALGGVVDTGSDWVRVHPLPAQLKPATIQTHSDHRIAMAFAVLGCARSGVSIANPDVVSKSWPGFWDALEAVSTLR